MNGVVKFNGQEFIVQDSKGFNLGACGGYLGYNLTEKQKLDYAKQAVESCHAEGRKIKVVKWVANTYIWSITK